MAGEGNDPVSPDIHVDQLGYLPSYPKIVYVSSPLGLPYQVLDAKSQEPILKGMLQFAKAGDPTSGAQVWRADCSLINATGLFILRVPGLGRSYPFRMDNNIYKNLSGLALKSFYLQRCGTALPEILAGPWGHTACHTADGVIFSASGANGTVHPATGGWHDGGDYGKYVVNGVYAAGLLLTLYDTFPQRFADGSLAIPESGNGIPDILDEVRWEVEWLLTMQAEDGGIYHKLTTLEPAKPSLPPEDKEPRFLMPVSTTATAGFCALAAKSSRLFRPFHADFAAKCLQAAQKAWRFLEAHPSEAGFENPPGVLTKAYNDNDDTDERFWAAIELFLAANDSRFEEIALALAKKRIPLLSSSGYWGNVMLPAVVTILQTPADQIDAKLHSTAQKNLLELASILMEKIHGSGYSLTINEGEFTWGSNATLLQNALVLLFTNQVQPNRDYLSGALDQLHYVAGRNPLSLCYVTGLGSHSPQHPHHPFSASDKKSQPVPGLLVGGPNQFLNDSVLKRLFTNTTAPAVTYVDDTESFASNETSLSWNAALAFVATWFSE